MSLVDITPLPSEDEIMDPATKQYVDLSAAIAEARSDAKLAEFRATMEAYTARADEREAAARRRADERQAAARERKEAARIQANEREAAAREREEAARKLAEEREAATRELVRNIFKTLDRIEAGMVSLKRTVITTAIAATLSTVFGVAAFNAALMQNIFAAIELGQKTSPPILKMQADIAEIKKQLAESRAARER
jgi:ATPase subunit of ABC transporter with duplicated ATPase domains